MTGRPDGEWVCGGRWARRFDRAAARFAACRGDLEDALGAPSREAAERSLHAATALAAAAAGDVATGILLRRAAGATGAPMTAGVPEVLRSCEEAISLLRLDLELDEQVCDGRLAAALVYLAESVAEAREALELESRPAPVLGRPARTDGAPPSSPVEEALLALADHLPDGSSSPRRSPPPPGSNPSGGSA
jgi:hypothetical protein